MFELNIKIIYPIFTRGWVYTLKYVCPMKACQLAKWKLNAHMIEGLGLSPSYMDGHILQQQKKWWFQDVLYFYFLLTACWIWMENGKTLCGSLSFVGPCPWLLLAIIMFPIALFTEGAASTPRALFSLHCTHSQLDCCMQFFLPISILSSQNTCRHHSQCLQLVF